MLNLYLVVSVCMIGLGYFLTPSKNVSNGDIHEILSNPVKKEVLEIQVKKITSTKMQDSNISKKNLGNEIYLKTMKVIEKTDMGRELNDLEVSNMFKGFASVIENQNLYDEELTQKYHNDIILNVKNNPEKSFKDINTMLNNIEHTKYPILRASLFAYASMIPEHKKEVNELAKEEILIKTIVADKEEKDTKTEKEFNEVMSDDQKPLPALSAYGAYIATVEPDADLVLKETIDMVKANDNKRVQKGIVAQFAEISPKEEVVDLLKTLDREGVKLLPSDINIETISDK